MIKLAVNVSCATRLGIPRRRRRNQNAPATGTARRVWRGLLLLGALVTAPAAHADLPAPGWPVDAPNGSDPWPTCADADAQYCIESATNNGVPASASVNVLPGTLGYNPESFNWSLPAATTAGDEAAITIRVGAFNPSIRLLSLTDSR